MFKCKTLPSGACDTCSDCGVTVYPSVQQSAAGYYIGTVCNCGPYSRESHYYATRSAALEALMTESYGR